MNQLINLLLLLIVTSFVLPASATIDVYASTDNNETSSSDETSSSSDESTDNVDSSSSSGSTDDNADTSTTSTDDNSPVQSEPTLNANTENAQGGDLANDVLAVHNQERAAVGVPPLTWSSSLAAGAQTWADNLISTGNIQHSPDAYSDYSKYGENIAWAGPPGSQTPTMLAQGWADEKSNFVPGTSGDSSTNHYTQMVWKDSTQVGCGLASGPGGPGIGGTDILVCQYSPPGNWNNQPPY